MSVLRLERDLDTSAEDAFRVMTDLPNLPEAIPEIVSITLLTDGPIGVGTRYKEARKMFGKVSEETFEVTTFEPPAADQPGRFVIEADTCGMHMTADHQVRDRDGGATVEFVMTSEPNPGAWFAKLVAPIAGLLTGPAMRKCIERDFDRLAEYAKRPDARRPDVQRPDAAAVPAG